jgi:hypothetical protein
VRIRRSDVEARAARVLERLGEGLQRSSKVATPLTDDTVEVPDRRPSLGLVPRATLTSVTASVVLSNSSRMMIWTGGVMGSPAFVVEGSVTKAILAGAAGLMLNGSLVTPVRPGELKVNA